MHFKENELGEAVKLYEEALAVDTDNELAVANKSLVELKQGNFKRCRASCDKAIAHIDRFTNYTSFNQEEKQSSARVLLIKGKLMIRKAVAFEREGDLEAALEAAKEAKNLNKESKEANQVFRKIEVGPVHNL